MQIGQKPKTLTDEEYFRTLSVFDRKRVRFGIEICISFFFVLSEEVGRTRPLVMMIFVRWLRSI